MNEKYIMKILELFHEKMFCGNATKNVAVSISRNVVPIYDVNQDQYHLILPIQEINVMFLLF